MFCAGDDISVLFEEVAQCWGGKPGLSTSVGEGSTMCRGTGNRMWVWTGLRVNVRVKMADQENYWRRRRKDLKKKSEGARGGRVDSELGEGARMSGNQGLRNPTHMEPMGPP